MPSDAEIHSVLLGFHDRLGSVEGKVNLIARANSPALLQVLNKAVEEAPLVGQIYVVLDGQRSQQQVVAALAAAGVSTSKQAVSRWIGKMETEHGIIDLVKPGVYRRHPEMERILNLSSKIRKWLADAGKPVPESDASRKRRAS